MLTIIIGIVLAVVIVFIGIAITIRTNSEDSMGFCITIAGIVLVVAIAIGSGINIGGSQPLSGYTEWKLINETELITLSNGIASGGTGLIYVSLSADSTYTYRYEIDSEFGTDTSKEYQTETLRGSNVIEVEDPNCKTPFIRIYQRDGKRSIWTFGWFNTQYKYVFYVPEGTIYKEVKLN